MLDEENENLKSSETLMQTTGKTKSPTPEKKDYISGAASGLVTGIGIVVIMIIKSMTWNFNVYFIWGSLTFIVVCGLLGALFGDKIIEKLTNMI